MFKRHFAFAQLCALALTACGTDIPESTVAPQLAAAQTDIQIIRWDATGRFGGQVRCTGEEVVWDLHLMIVFRTTTDANGGFHGTFTVHDQGSSGVGVTTGAKYRMVTAQAESYNVQADQLPETVTAIFNRRFISQGSIENFQVHNVFHMTVDGDGKISSFKNTVSRVCN